MQEPKCLDQNLATFVCINQKCQQSNPFICSGCVNHECEYVHSNCVLKRWTNFKTDLQKSKKINNPEFIKLSRIIEDTLNKCINYLQKQSNYLNLWKSTFGMPTKVVDLLKNIKQNQQSNWNGKAIAKIIKQMNNQNQIESINQSKIQRNVKIILAKAEQLQLLIRELYSPSTQQQSRSVYSPPKEITIFKNQTLKQIKTGTNFQLYPLSPNKPKQIHINIKQYSLDDLNKKLMKITQKPQHLRLKVHLLAKILFILIYIEQNLFTFLEVSYNVIKCNFLSLNQRVTSIMIKWYSNIKILGYHFILQLVQGVYYRNLFIGSILMNDIATIMQYQSNQVAKSLLNTNLSNVKTITLYYPWVLGYHLNIAYEKLISSSVLGLPNLQLFILIANQIKSLQGFRNLGSKLKVSKEPGWDDNELW